MTGKMERPLPSYKNPPVHEVVCGLRFQPTDKLRIPHIGFLWKKFRADYPIIKHVPPIATAKGEILIDQDIGMPLPRMWFISKSDDKLIQFQSDRFYFNWRRREEGYPRYKSVIENFEYVLNNIASFFDELDLGELEPIEYELSYINQIPKGEIWDTANDLPKIFSDFVWQTKERFLPNPKGVAWQAEFPLPEQNGHLFINLKQAVRTEDEKAILVLELKARGIGKSTNKEDFHEWFGLAREWIVRGFTDITTPEIQKIWEREDNA